jgi:hypothetical protein
MVSGRATQQQPATQYQTYYAFLAPDTFLHSYVTVVASVGAGSEPIYLDDQPLGAVLFTGPIGTSGYGAARVSLDGGEHVITSAAPFGITVYGFASYPSYLYPGRQGLDALPPLAHGPLLHAEPPGAASAADKVHQRNGIRL